MKGNKAKRECQTETFHLGNIDRLWKGCHLNQGLENIPCKEPDSKYLWLLSQTASFITIAITEVEAFAKRENSGIHIQSW